MMDVITREEYLRSRNQHPRNEAVQFVENRIVLAGQSETVYSEHVDNFVTVQQAAKQQRISVELWKQADIEKEQLFANMERVRAKLAKKGGSEKDSLNLRSCKWEQVMQEVQSTATHWRASTKSSKTTLCIDKIGRNSDVFASWLELLPAGDYGSSICGVFKIAFEAAGQYSKVEEAIFEALSDIPEILESSRRYIEIYAELRIQPLEEKTFHLFRAILRTLAQIMQFFADSSFRKFYESVLKLSSYKSELLASLEEVKKHNQKVKDEAVQCHAMMTHGHGRHITAAHENSEQALNILQPMYKMLRERIVALATENQDVNRRLVALESGQESNLLEERESKAIALREARMLLEHLHFDSTDTSNDTAFHLQAGRSLDERPKARAAALVTNERFKAFISHELASSSLLVNGRADLASAEGISPLSFVAAELSRITEATEHVFIVKFFCGRHPPRYDQPSPQSALCDLMASLVGQLVSQMLEKEVDINLSFPTREDWRGGNNLKLPSLCRIFSELTSQLPSKNLLICIIDEIAQYETMAMAKDTDLVIRKLTRLVRRRENIIFKFLVTSHGRALRVSKHFVGHTLDLPEEIEVDDSAAWKIATMGT